MALRLLITVFRSEQKKRRRVMGRKSTLPVAQRREAVLMLLRREEPGAVLARGFEVSEATLYRWLCGTVADWLRETLAPDSSSPGAGARAFARHPAAAASAALAEAASGLLPAGAGQARSRRLRPPKRGYVALAKAGRATSRGLPCLLHLRRTAARSSIRLREDRLTRMSLEKRRTARTDRGGPTGREQDCEQSARCSAHRGARPSGPCPDVSSCGAGRDEPSGLSCDEGPRAPAQTPSEDP